MPASSVNMGPWLDYLQRQRVLLIGGLGVAAVLVLQFHHWYSERRRSNRRGRLRPSTGRGSSDGAATDKGDGSAAIHATRHPADMAFTPTGHDPLTPGRDLSSLYPFEALDDTTAASEESDVTLLSAPISHADTSSPSFSLASSAPSASASTVPSSASATRRHVRVSSVSNEVPREQMFYGLLNIIATVPGQHEANGAVPHSYHTALDTQHAAASSSVPTSTSVSPRRPAAQPHHVSSLSSDSLQRSQLPSSVAPPAAGAGGASDKRLIQALQSKWQRQQRRLAKRERRERRRAGLLDDASTASPSNSSVSSVSAMGDDELPEGVEFEYESGEELADGYKLSEEHKQPVLLSSTASTTSSSSTSSPTFTAALSPSPTVSRLTITSLPRSPQRLNGYQSGPKSRLDFHSHSVQRDDRWKASAGEDNEVKR